MKLTQRNLAAAFLLPLAFLAQSCGDDPGTTVKEITPEGNNFEQEALNLYSFDAVGIESMLTDIFQLPPMTTQEQTAAENLQGVKDECIQQNDVCLTTARQFLHRYRTAFVGGGYTVVNQMRIVGIMGLACSATPDASLKSGDPMVIGSAFLNRPVDSTELSILSSAIASLPANLQNQATCVTIAASPEAYGQIR